MKDKYFIWKNKDLTRHILYQAHHNKLFTTDQYPKKIILSPHWSNILIHMHKISFIKGVEVSRHIKTDLSQQKLLISPPVCGTKNNVSYQVEFASKTKANRQLVQKHIGNIHTHVSPMPFSASDLTNLLTKPAALLAFLINQEKRIFLIIRTKHTPYCRHNNDKDKCKQHLITLFSRYFKNNPFPHHNNIHFKYQQQLLFNLFICQKYHLVFFMGSIQKNYPITLYRHTLIKKSFLKNIIKKIFRKEPDVNEIF